MLKKEEDFIELDIRDLKTIKGHLDIMLIGYYGNLYFIFFFLFLKLKKSISKKKTI